MSFILEGTEILGLFGSDETTLFVGMKKSSGARGRVGMMKTASIE